MEIRGVNGIVNSGTARRCAHNGKQPCDNCTKHGWPEHEHVLKGISRLNAGPREK